MAELKTKQTDESVSAFVDGIKEEGRRQDCLALLELFKKATKQEPKIWGSSIVGFGSYRYKYPTGREGEWFMAGFSPRKQNLTLYVMPGLHSFPDLLAKLGKFKTGKSCLYIKSLKDIDLAVLSKMVTGAVRLLKDGIELFRENQRNEG